MNKKIELNFVSIKQQIIYISELHDRFRVLKENFVIESMKQLTIQFP